MMALSPGRRTHAAGGYTLVELCVAMALLGVIITVGLRLVFLTDRAVEREAREAAQGTDALALAAVLHEDLQGAVAAEAPKDTRLELTAANCLRIAYVSDGAGVRRLQFPKGEDIKLPLAEEDAGTVRTREFPAISAEFSVSDLSLVKAMITDESGGELRVAVHPRNVPVEPPPEDAMGSGPPGMGMGGPPGMAPAGGPPPR